MSSSGDEGSELQVGAEVVARYQGRWYQGIFEGAAAEEEQKWRVQCREDKDGVKTFTNRVKRAKWKGEWRKRERESDAEEEQPKKRRWKLRKKGLKRVRDGEGEEERTREEQRKRRNTSDLVGDGELERDTG